jgi:23S rRNA (uracil1939-C5)-methyltransferase
VQIPYQMHEGKVICGFYKGGTHDVIPFEECFIQPNLSTEIALFIKDLANKYNITAYDENTKKGNLRHVLIRNTVNNDYMVVLITNEEKLPYQEKIVSELIKKYPNIKSIIQNINNKPTNVILGEKTNLFYGSLTLLEKIMGFNFILSYKSFFQTNHIQTEKLYSKVLEYAAPTKEDVIVDGYCGVGTISLVLAQKAKYVYGIEIVKDAIKDAKDNARLNDIDNVEFIVGKTEEEILKFKDINIDTIIVDPPRKGCDKQLLDAIIAKKIKRIVYVSCNDATLARDLKILADDYEIKDITLFDMFPHSVHVECVVLMSRVKDRKS